MAEENGNAAAKKSGRREVKPLSDAQIEEVLSVVRRALKEKPFLNNAIMNIATQSRGARAVNTITGECEGLASATETLDRVMVHVSRQTLFGKPEVLRARQNAELAIMEAGEKISDAIKLLIQGSDYEVKNIRNKNLQEMIKGKIASEKGDGMASETKKLA